jgi:ankyrin repeat protein
MSPFCSRIWHSLRSQRGIVALVVLAWGSVAFCGVIHDAAKNGDLEKAKVPIKANPDLVFSKDTFGTTPLHFAAASGHKDVAELLLADKGRGRCKSQ